MASGYLKFNAVVIEKGTIMVYQTSRNLDGSKASIHEAEAGRLLSVSEAVELRNILDKAIQEEAGI